MENQKNRGSKRSHDYGSDSGEKDSQAKDSVPKRQKAESGRPTVASAPSRGGGGSSSMKPPRATPEQGVASSAGPPPSLAIRAIQGMNNGQRDSRNTPVPSVQSTPRTPGVSQYKPPSSSRGPAILRASPNFKGQLPVNVPRIIQVPVPVPVTKQRGSVISRSDRPESAARSRAASSGSSSRPSLLPPLPNTTEPDDNKRIRELNEWEREMYKVSPSNFLKSQGIEPSHAKPALKQQRKPSTPGDGPAGKDYTSGSNKPAAAHDVSADPQLEQPIKQKGETFDDYCKRVRDFHEQDSSNSTDTTLPILRREGESLQDFRERQKAHCSASPFDKKRPDETIEEFQRRQDAHYKKYKLGKYKNAKREADDDEPKPKVIRSSKKPAARFNSRRPSASAGTSKPSASSTKDSRDFDVEAVTHMNESRDPASGIEFPPELFETLTELDVPKSAEFNPGDVEQGYHSLPVYVVVLEQNRQTAYFNVLGTAQVMKTVNMLALALFRQEVPKLLPELRESLGLDHETEKESLAQLQERLGREWTKDVWTKTTGDIRKTARLS